MLVMKTGLGPKKPICLLPLNVVYAFFIENTHVLSDGYIHLKTRLKMVGAAVCIRKQHVYCLPMKLAHERICLCSLRMALHGLF